MDTYEDHPHPSDYDGFCITCRKDFKAGDMIQLVEKARRGHDSSDFEHATCAKSKS